MDVSQVDLRKLPDKPKTEGYEWTGTLGPYPCVLFGDRELTYDLELGTMVLANQHWSTNASPVTTGRLKRFQSQIPPPGELFLASIYKDVGTGVTVGGQHQAKRGGWKFHAIFKVLERGDDWVRAMMLRRS